MRKNVYNIVAPLILVFVVLVLMMPRTAKFNYDYRKGRPWKYETLFAQFDFPIYKTDEQLRQERSSFDETVIPYYRFSEEITNKNLKAISGLDLENLRNAVISAMRSIYQKGVIQDETTRKFDGSLSNEVIFIQKNKRAEKVPLSEVYKVSDARAKLLADISPLTRRNVDSLFRKAGVYDYLVPNVLFDEQTTTIVHSESDKSVSPTSGYVSAGQLIVSSGEIVTSDIAQILDSYKREYVMNMGAEGPAILYWIGNILIALGFVVILFLAIYYANRRIFLDSRYPYLLTVFSLAALTGLLIVRTNENLLFYIPFTLFALYLQAFMRKRVIAPVYIISLMPLLVFAHNGAVLFVMYIVAGMIAIYVFDYFQKGWRQFVTAFITFGVLALLYLGFRAADLIEGNVWLTLLSLFIGSMLTVAGYPLVFLFEKLFNLVSNSRLIELCDTSNPLVRELEKKAPGTFQHSLQVMNMVEAVARAVDDNPNQLRAGALYHDLGKMNNPLCFVENESVALKTETFHKYHEDLTPLQSAQDIIRHVTDGVEIAKKHHLPSIIVDFIKTHHGTTKVTYFYNKFLQQGGSEENVSDFTYPGPPPSTKSQILLMLCDSVEAASRTLTDYSLESCSRFIDRIVAGKMEEGQFDNADITVRELSIVKDTLVNYLAQTHHERIVYPNRKNKKNKSILSL